MAPAHMDEEGRTLLRRIVERLAWRQVGAMNILGHCLKHVTRIDSKVLVAEELNHSLLLFREVRALYAELGWTDLESVVRERVGELPFPGSRLEFGLCRFLGDRAERVAMQSYVDCVDKRFAAIARTALETKSVLVPEGDDVFVEYCRDVSNRPHAQQMFDRWLAISVRSFGRAGTPADRRAVELGLRKKSNADLIRDFVGEIDPFRERCGLERGALGELAALGAGG